MSVSSEFCLTGARLHSLIANASSQPHQAVIPVISCHCIFWHFEDVLEPQKPWDRLLA